MNKFYYKNLEWLYKFSSGSRLDPNVPLYYIDVEIYNSNGDKVLNFSHITKYIHIDILIKDSYKHIDKYLRKNKLIKINGKV